MRSRRVLRCWPIVLLLALPLPAAAQSEDEQTRDYEEQDRRYYERYAEQEPEPEKPAESTPDPIPPSEDFESFLATAEALVKNQYYRSGSTEHYRVQTDDVRIDTDAVLALLETFRAYFEDFWDERLELARHDAQARVFLIRSFKNYNDLLGADFRREIVRPKGHYIQAFDIIAAHSGAGRPQELTDAVVHEAAHQLVGTRIFAGKDDATPWISEGLASYFGYTYRDKNGTFRPGAIGGKSTRLMRDIPRGQSIEGSSRLRAFKKRLKTLPSAEGTFVDYLVRMRDPMRFYGGDVDLHYAGSWLLVHFLFHGNEGRYATPFARYLELETEGRGGAEVLYRELGATPEHLDSAFFEYVGRLKPR
jgi:hypothetical protein